MYRVYRYDNGVLHKIPKYECNTIEDCHTKINKLRKIGWNSIQLVIVECLHTYSSRIVEIVNPVTTND